jgi:hypothetical protein
MMFNLSRFISNNPNQHNLDESTPWFEFLSYVEVCASLGPIPNQPSVGRWMRYRAYLNEVGVL